MSVPNIPSKINSYNVYNDAERLIGVGDEVTLPDFEAISEIAHKHHLRKPFPAPGSWANWTTPPWAISPTWKWRSPSASWTARPPICWT